MTVGQIAALVAAVAFVVLVLLLAVPLLKLGRTLDEATVAIRKAHEGAGPVHDEAGATVAVAGIPPQRGVDRDEPVADVPRVDGPTAGAPAVAAGGRGPSPLVAATLGEPLVKIAALSYGLRKATQARIQADVTRSSAASAASRRSRRARR